MKSFQKKIILFLKGLMMGIADLIPGISGGTIALITNIYEELIHSINSISLGSFINLKNKGIKYFWKEINGKFLFPVFFGIIFSVFFFSKIISWLLINEPVSLWSFFFAITISSFYYFYEKIGDIKFLHYFLIFIGAVFSLIFTISINLNISPNYFYIFISGFIAITAMILPGISGSYLLLILGVYPLIIKSLNDLQSFIFKFNSEIFINSFNILLLFFLGAIVGLKIMSKYISKILYKYPKKTLSFLLGLMIGSVHKLWPWQNNIDSSDLLMFKNKSIVLPNKYDGPPELIKAFVFMVLGSILFFTLSRLKKFK
ncbi:MAG: DUF368 domain-containing protein [Flavobacteriaceae bacterium]|nr:DUF368 domain-containing protein [Flavobacteriaceae bacterium]